MKKLLINTGTRDGYIYLCEGKYKTPEYKETKIVDFAACNATKQTLYKIYNFIVEKTVKVLARLTSTGKTRVILVEDDFLKKLKAEVEKIEDEDHKSVTLFIER